METETDELLPTRTDGHQRMRQNVEKDASLRWMVGSQRRRGKKLEG